jgi:hypothetical protein
MSTESRIPVSLIVGNLGPRMVGFISHPDERLGLGRKRGDQ